MSGDPTWCCPPHAAGSDTSKAAAESMRKLAPGLRERVLAWIARRGQHGSTCDQVEMGMGLTHQTASARIHELARSGAIIDSAARRPTRSGRAATVWVAR